MITISREILSNHQINLMVLLQDEYDMVFLKNDVSAYSRRKTRNMAWNDETIYTFEVDCDEIVRIDNNFDLKLYFTLLVFKSETTFAELCRFLDYSYQNKNINRMKQGMRNLNRIGLLYDVGYNTRNGGKGSTITYKIKGRLIDVEYRKRKENDNSVSPIKIVPSVGKEYPKKFVLDPTMYAPRVKKKEFIDGDEEDFDFGFH